MPVLTLQGLLSHPGGARTTSEQWEGQGGLAQSPPVPHRGRAGRKKGWGVSLEEGDMVRRVGARGRTAWRQGQRGGLVWALKARKGEAGSRVGGQPPPRVENLRTVSVMSGPSSSLWCPLSKAGISQDHQCLTQWGHRPRCQHLDQAWGLCKHPSPEQSPSPKSWPTSGVQVHLLNSVGCLAARAQRVVGAETVGFLGHPTFLQSDRGPLGNLRCRPAGTDSPYGARGQDRLGLRVGTGP